MPVFGKRSISNLKGVHPDLVRLMIESIKDCPVDFTITEGVRTTQRQQQLYAQGRTVPGIIVTHKDGVNNKSNHQIKKDGYGHAVDLYPFMGGRVKVSDSYVPYRLKDISIHIKKVAKYLGIKVVWGGDWEKPNDPPHFELG